MEVGWKRGEGVIEGGGMMLMGRRGGHSVDKCYWFLSNLLWTPGWPTTATINHRQTVRMRTATNHHCTHVAPSETTTAKTRTLTCSCGKRTEGDHPLPLVVSFGRGQGQWPREQATSCTVGRGERENQDRTRGCNTRRVPEQNRAGGQGQDPTPFPCTQPLVHTHAHTPGVTVEELKWTSHFSSVPSDGWVWTSDRTPTQKEESKGLRNLCTDFIRLKTGSNLTSTIPSWLPGHCVSSKHTNVNPHSWGRSPEREATSKRKPTLVLNLSQCSLIFILACSQTSTFQNTHSAKCFLWGVSSNQRMPTFSNWSNSALLYRVLPRISTFRLTLEWTSARLPQSMLNVPS